jgi:hypothetical protein
MCGVAQIIIALAVAIVGDAAIYAYSARERPPGSQCGNIIISELKERAEAAQREASAIRTAAILVNGSVIAAISGALRRLRRARERLPEIEMMA